MLNFFLGWMIILFEKYGYKVLSKEEHDDLMYSKGVGEATSKYLKEFNSICYAHAVVLKKNDLNADQLFLQQSDTGYTESELYCLRADAGSNNSNYKLGLMRGFSHVKDINESIKLCFSIRHHLLNELNTSIGRLRREKDSLQKKLEYKKSNKQKHHTRKPKA